VNPVLDASVFVATISPAERHHDQARALFESHPDTLPYLVPALFRVEVISALSRRGEGDEVIDLVDALVRGPRFHGFPVDEALLAQATQVARAAGLRAYDAVYVALAVLQEAPLYTLDRDLHARVAAACPGVTVKAGA